MNPKQVTILAILVAIAGGIYFVVNQKQGKSINKEEIVKIGKRAVDDFKVADVTELKIFKTGQSVDIKKDGDNWVVTDRENYAADANKIRGLLFTIKDLKITESRNVRGETALKSLVLLHPNEAGPGGSGAGTVIEISAGDQKRGLIFGANYNSSGRTGRFVKSTEGGVYIVSTVLNNLETDPAAWLDKEFFKILKAKSIVVQHEKPEDSFELVRESDGATLALKNPQEGEELEPSKLGALPRLFASANFVDYLTGDAATPDKTGLDKAVTVTVDTFEGFNYVVKISNKKGDSKSHLSYEVSAELGEAPGPEPEIDEEAEKDLSDEERAAKATERSAREAERNTHERLTEKLASEKKFAGKVYKVDSWLVEPIIKKRGELLQTEEDRKAAAAAAAGAAAGAGGGRPPGGGNPGVTAYTPPIAVDPSNPAMAKAAAEEKAKQERAVIEQQRKRETNAAIRRMLEDQKRENAESKAADKVKPAEDKPAEAKPAGAKPAGAKPAGAKPAGAKPAGAKPAGAKPAGAKPAGAKPAGAKPAGAKPAEDKPAEDKPAEDKPAEAKPAEAKPAEAKPAEAKPAEAKPAEAKPAEGKPAV